MSPEQVQGQARRRALGHLLFRRDPLRNALGAAVPSAATPRPRRCRRSSGGPAGNLPCTNQEFRPRSTASCATASRRALTSDSTPRTMSRSPSRRSRIRARAPAARRDLSRSSRLARSADRRGSSPPASWLSSLSSPRAPGSRLADPASAPEPSFKQLTFRRGNVGPARLRPTARPWSTPPRGWKPFAVYSMRSGSPDFSPLDVPGGAILAVSPQGLLALQTGRRTAEPFVSVGTLAEAHLTGGEAARAAPRRAVGRLVSRRQTPRDRSRYRRQESAGIAGRHRALRDDRLDRASALFPERRRDRAPGSLGRVADMGTVVLVPLSGKPKPLSQGWSTVQGLAC